METMEENIMPAAHRTITGKKVKNLRLEGKLPGVIYGPNMEKPLPITLDRKEATKMLVFLTQSSLITIKIGKEEFPVLLKETQKDYIRGILTHVDFVAVSAGELIKTNIVVELVGEAPAIKDFNGVLIQPIASLQVECMPKDLPPRYVIDISELANIGDSIFVRDIITSDKITVFDDPDAPVVAIIGATLVVEEEIEEEEGLELISDSDEPEVIDKGKKEDEDE